MRTALHHLAALDLTERKAKHPTMRYMKADSFSDKDANALTQAVIRWCELHTPFASRMQSTGQYRADLQRFVPSQQRAGMPDVYTVILGRAVHIEIKRGKDRLSDVQKNCIDDLLKSGAAVFVARDFQTFHDWFNLTFPPFNEADELPFGPVSSPFLQ